jgi:low affinity Fe/Cu permease
MSLKSLASNFITNPTVRLVVIAISVLNVAGYLMTGGLTYAICFAVVAFLVKYFSKNITVMLGVPLILVNYMASFDPRYNSFREGLTDQKKIDELVKRKQQEDALSIPITGPVDIEGFVDNNMEESSGAEMGAAYSNSVQLDFVGNNKEGVARQMRLLESTKKMSPLIEKLTNIENKLKPLAPLNL